MKRKTIRTLNEILILAFAVLLIRVLYIEGVLHIQSAYDYSFGDVVSVLFTNYPVMFLMLAADIFLVRWLNRKLDYGRRPVRRFSLELLLLGAFTALITLLLHLSATYTDAHGLPFFLTFLGVLLINALIVAVTDIVFYYHQSHKKALNIEIVKKNKARFQYDQLKQQLNPHFLFNSLTVLDYLIHTDPDKASDFVGKLAGIYRYLLSKENEILVLLKDELDFALSYVDLLKERFDKGLEVTMEVSDTYHNKQIIPCGLQLLIENATKHNVINPETPLVIRVYVEDDFIVVHNNLQPRLHHRPESPGVGLKNIEGQYRTAFHKTIEVVKTKNSFIVRIPLLN
jgi:sensor histidine kinase YesM